MHVVRIVKGNEQTVGLHLENGSLSLGNAPDNWATAQWELVPVGPPTTDLLNVFQIRNKEAADRYLTVEGESLQATSAQKMIVSTYWQIIPQGDDLTFYTIQNVGKWGVHISFGNDTLLGDSSENVVLTFLAGEPITPPVDVGIGPGVIDPGAG